MILAVSCAFLNLLRFVGTFDVSTLSWSLRLLFIGVVEQSKSEKLARGDQSSFFAMLLRHSQSIAY